MRYCIMSGMIDPGRFAEDVAGNPPFSTHLQQKADTEAMQDWEDEGGTSAPLGETTAAGDFPVVPPGTAGKGTECT